MVSWGAHRQCCQALDHPSCADQRHRGQQEHAAAQIATQVPDGTKPESRVKRFARWVGNDTITTAVYFVPYADVLLRHLAVQTLVLVLDGSVVGRGCVALMMSVVYKGRALPVAWRVHHGHKGHFPEDLHLTLVEQVKALIPQDAPVVVLGDGAFDGTGLLDTLHTAGWSYVCRTALAMTAAWEGTPFRLDTMGGVSRQAPWLPYRRRSLHGTIMVRFSSSVVGPKGIKSRCIW